MPNHAQNPLLPDLEQVLKQTEAIWPSLRDASVLLTGGTGFIGCWLLETLLHARQQLGLNTRVTVLTRSPGSFRAKAPHLAGHEAVRLCQGDVLDWTDPKTSFSHVIAAATTVSSASARTGEGDGYEEHTLAAVRRTLECARQSGAKRFLFLSSGAVYGSQTQTIEHVSEDTPLEPNTPYGRAKLAAEQLCLEAMRQQNLGIIIARIFALIGPWQPLDAGYAVTDFIRDARAGRPIRIRGDGSTIRSYLYAADLAAWLWTLLLWGEPGEAYNVGSETALSVRQLAEEVRQVFNPDLTLAFEPSGTTPGGAPPRYVPSCRKISQFLGYGPLWDLSQSLQGTRRFLEQQEIGSPQRALAKRQPKNG